MQHESTIQHKNSTRVTELSNQLQNFQLSKSSWLDNCFLIKFNSIRITPEGDTFLVKQISLSLFNTPVISVEHIPWCDPNWVSCCRRHLECKFEFFEASKQVQSMIKPHARSKIPKASMPYIHFCICVCVCVTCSKVLSHSTFIACDTVKAIELNWKA